MIKATDLKGKAVISVDRAAKLGEVESAYIDSEARRIIALEVDAADTHDKLAIPTDSIRTVGRDAITVEGARSLVHPSRLPEITLGYNVSQLIGANVVTQSGKSLGKITDVYLDERNLSIVEYQLSGDLWQRLSQDMPTFRPTPGMRLGESMLIVPDQVEQAIEQSRQTISRSEQAPEREQAPGHGQLSREEQSRMEDEQRRREQAAASMAPPPASPEQQQQSSEAGYYAAPDTRREIKEQELETQRSVIEQRIRDNQQQLQQIEEERQRLRQTQEQEQQPRQAMPEEQRYAAPPQERVQPRAEPEPYNPHQRLSAQPTEDEELLRKHIDEDRRLLERLQRERETGEPPQRT